MSEFEHRERWKLIEDLFHRALEIPTLQRNDFIKAASADDERIEHEVRSLLEAFECSTEFLEDLENSERALLDELCDELQPAGERQRLKFMARGSHKDEVGSERSATLPEKTSPRAGRYRSSLSPLEPGLPFDVIKQAIESERPDYELREEIGRGGTGIVFRARDHRLDRDLAIKVLHRGGSLGFDETTQAGLGMLEQEGRAAASLASDHIVRVLEIVDSSYPFLVLEWISGPSLRQLLAKHETLAPIVAADIGRQIARGIGAAHLRGLTHGDIKPANVLLEAQWDSTTHSPELTWETEFNLENWRVKVADFGMATTTDVENEEGPAYAVGKKAFDSKRFVGTPAYASPDTLLLRSPCDARSDVWSAGATLYRMLAGVTPYRGAPHTIVRQMENSEPIRARILNPQIPLDLESICMKALARDPQQRYANGIELAEDLDRFLSGYPVLARPISNWQKFASWSKRNPKLAWMSAGLVAMIFVSFVGALVFAAVMASMNRRIVAQTRESDLARLQRIIEADPALLPLGLDALPVSGELAFPLLNNVINDPHSEYQAKVNAAIALAELGEVRAEILVEAVQRATLSPNQCQNLIRGLRHANEESVQRLALAFSTSDSDDDKIRLAIVAWSLHAPQLFEQIAEQDLNPTLRTRLIHTLPDFHPSIDEVDTWLSTTHRSDVQYLICMALALMANNNETQSVAQKQKVLSQLETILSVTNDPGVFSAASTALSRWQESNVVALSTVTNTSHSASSPMLTRIEPATDQPWLELEPDLRLMRIPAGSADLGRTSEILYSDYPRHRVNITKPYYLADRETTIGMFQQFLNDPGYPPAAKPDPSQRIDPEAWVSPTPRHPVQRVSWYEATMFCNWLSHRYGRQPRYEFSDDRTLVKINYDADGFHLPTEAQWEMACRAGSETMFSFGDDFDLFHHYGAFSSARKMSAVICGSLLPNRFGLFEMHGNVWEWCEDWYSPGGEVELTDPYGPENSHTEEQSRIYRGGGIATSSGEPISSARGRGSPESQFLNLGFRVALPVSPSGND
ncbi:MAG TPA: bifunctional serine/threonine-protein kinase/formylglycine-generating enzyme family protein [Pirellulaceae bacterium]|nr:bifunctional serine/threonine-protein kinase/formylglycine-generating enzyme family protein [Pirellulaceae bacterium]HMP68297.1 bifunctional serine/threonine-protein kinase/formylglycine-generating enzyme family protein [Pirellulaceae bacterium]